MTTTHTLYRVGNEAGIDYDEGRKRLITFALDDAGNTFSVSVPVGRHSLKELAESIALLAEVLDQ